MDAHYPLTLLTEAARLMMAADAEPRHLQEEINERVTDLYRQLERRNRWLRNYFRKATRNDADIEEMINDTFSVYLKPIAVNMWLNPGVQAVSITPEDDSLFDPDFGFVGGSAFIRSSPVFMDPVADFERYTYTFPKTWLRKCASTVLIDRVRKLKSGAGSSPAAGLGHRKGRKRLIRMNRPLHALSLPSAQEVRAALQQLPDGQRAAWILCRDKLHILNPQEAEALLAPVFTGDKAKDAIAKRLLSVEEAAQLFGRDVSPDASKAATKLTEILSPLKPNAGEWRAASRIGRAGLLRSMLLGKRTPMQLPLPHPETGPAGGLHPFSAWPARFEDGVQSRVDPEEQMTLPLPEEL